MTLSGLTPRAVVGKVLLGMQRRASRLPASVRSALSKGPIRFVSTSQASVVEDWSAPLLPRKGVHVTAPEVVDREQAGHLPGSGVGGRALEVSTVRCAIMTESIDVGGMDEVVALLARRLPERGIAVVVLHTPLAPQQQVGRLGTALRSAGVDVVDLRAGGVQPFLRSWQPDVVSAHGAPDWAVQEAASTGVPVVETLHGMHGLFGADPRQVRSRGAWLAGVVAVSTTVAEQYAAFGAVPAERLRVVPNGVSLSRANLPDRARSREWLGIGDQFLFLSLARHCLQKNTYGLVSAFGEVAARHPGAHLLVAGRPDDPPYAAQVRALRDRMPQRANIHLRDHAANPRLLLAAADGFVLDSFFEGWALASMEALVAGVPVVMSEVGGAAEQLADASRGVLVPNPLGHPLAVDWDAIAKARFGRQVNRLELVNAMDALVTDRLEWAARRSDIARKALTDFDEAVWVSRHEAIVREFAGISDAGQRVGPPASCR